MSPEQAVGGVSATDAWVILPQFYSDRNAAKVSIYHFNGASWTQLPTPTGAYTAWHGASATSMAVLTTNNVWAVGNGVYPVDRATNGQTPFVLHWDGSRWLYFRNPPSFKSGTGQALSKVSADAPNDVWVAGTAGTPSATYLARWNGSAWTEISTRVASGGVSALKAFGPNDVWFTTFGQSTTVFHWNGATIQAQPLPPLYGLLPNILRTLAGTSSTDLWVGAANNYIAHRSASWSPFVVSDVSVKGLLTIIEFRHDYALATVNGDIPDLLVYDGIHRWRDTSYRLGPYTAFNASATQTGTNFWAILEDLNVREPPFSAFAALVTCPSNPPIGIS